MHYIWVNTAEHSQMLIDVKASGLKLLYFASHHFTDVPAVPTAFRQKYCGKPKDGFYCSANNWHQIDQNYEQILLFKIEPFKAS